MEELSRDYLVSILLSDWAFLCRGLCASSNSVMVIFVCHPKKAFHSLGMIVAQISNLVLYVDIFMHIFFTKAFLWKREYV